jgi:hypothetical protein
MPDLLVVVPGVTGSVLRRPAGGEVWSLSLTAVTKGLLSFRRTVESLRLPADLGDAAPVGPAALTADRLIMGWHVWPGFWAGAGYGRLLSYLNGIAPGAVRAFPYDWRLSNRYNARLLGRAVEAWLDEWRARPGHRDAKVIFVCHSMGGLIARYFLEVLEGRELARRLITVGTPFAGSVKAVSALTGDAFAKLASLGWDEPLAVATRTFPSVYQLLPTYRCVRTAGEPAGLDALDVPGADDAMVRDGLAFHRTIAEAVAANGPPPYELFAFAGKLQPTVQSVELGAVRRYLREQRGVDHLGDGTVALFAAVPPEWPNTAAAILYPARHSGLTGVTALLDAAADKILARELGGVLAPPCELGLDVPDVVDGGSVPVLVTADRPDLRLHAGVYHPDAPSGRAGPASAAAPIEEIRLAPDGSGTYRGTLDAPPGLWRLEVAAVAEVPPVSVADYVTVVSGTS